MTDTTREAVERLAHKYTGYGQHDVVDMLRALLTRAEAAGARAYTLAVAIMGGEDAPGYADSIDTGILAYQLRKERADQSAWVDACVKVGREAAEADRDALAAKLALAVEALTFYGNESHYVGEHIADPCGCCGSWYEPLIHKDGQDSGNKARATLAQLTTDTPEEGKDDDQ